MGGAEIQIKYLVEFLLEKNVEVHYIYEDKKNKINSEEYPNLILHPLNWIKITKRFGNRWFLYKKEIYKLLHKIKPDGIYTRFFSSWNSFASDFSKQNKITHVWAIASDNDLKILGKAINWLKPLDIIENKYVKNAFKKATHIIVQNNWQKIKLKQNYNRNGIYLKQAAPIDKMLPPKKNSTLNIVWIANMKPLKRPEIFIKIANEFKKANEIKFQMVGRLDNTYLSKINKEERINSNFKYLGELNNNEVNKLLFDTDILINTSDYEGFSNTFIQAWMRENIVISMNSNPDEILTKFNIGFLCPSIEDIYKKIHFLKDNQIILCEMQKKALDYARKEHNLEINLNTIYNLFKLK